MKKTLTAFLLTLCMAVLLACPALAETSPAPAASPAASQTTESAAADTTEAAASATDTAEYPTDVKMSADTYVMDTQNVLTQDEADALSEKCASLAEQYQCAVYVVVTDTIGDDDDAYDVAKNDYRGNALGYGEKKSGIMIYNAVGSRKYAVIAYGDGNYILTDYGREELIDDTLVPGLKSGDYAAAYSDSVDVLSQYMEDYANGDTYDVDKSPEGHVVTYLYVFGIPLAIALCFCLYFKSKMNTAHEATEADDYLLKKQFHVTKKTDTFLYKTVTVTHHDSDSGGGTSVDSDGFSGSSGSY